jgi:hypothetical protein
MLQPIKFINYSPEGGANSVRDKLYIRYMRKTMPDAKLLRRSHNVLFMLPTDKIKSQPGDNPEAPIWPKDSGDNSYLDYKNKKDRL